MEAEDLMLKRRHNQTLHRSFAEGDLKECGQVWIFTVKEYRRRCAN